MESEPSETIKIFVGNLAPYASQYRLQKLFESFGDVAECVVLGKYAFVHMYDMKAAEESVKELHRTLFSDQRINVEIAKNDSKPKGIKKDEIPAHVLKNIFKIFVTNVAESASEAGLKALFEAYGEVYSCCMLKKMAIVHMIGKDVVGKAVKNLNDSVFEGQTLDVSTSRGKAFREQQKSNQEQFHTTDPTLKLFVRNLSELVTREDVMDLFSQFGRINECIVLGTYGFVHMHGSENCHKAISARNGKPYAGKNLVVQISNQTGKGGGNNHETHKLFVGNLKDMTDEQELRSCFEQYGEVVECTVIKSGKYGFVHMTDRAEANNAVQNLHRSLVCGSRIRVDFSDNASKTHRTNPGDTVKLFVGNLTMTATETKLQALFEPYGEVVECDILKMFGFVHMASKEEAEAAIQGLQRTDFEGAKINIQFAGQNNPKQTYNRSDSKNSRRDDSPPDNMDPSVLVWKIYIGNLGGYALEDDLRTMFEAFGEVKEVAIVGKAGFVHMVGEQSAQNACRAINNTEYAGNVIHVKISQQNKAIHAKLAEGKVKQRFQKTTKIFCGNLTGDDCTEENVRALFEDFGEVTECVLLTRYAFIHMVDRDAAHAAIEFLHGKHILGARLRVELHQKADKTQREFATKLFVGNLRGKKTPEAEERLRQMFGMAGDVVDCTLMGKFAFVHMGDHQAAIRAVERFHNSNFDGTNLIVEISETDKGREQKDYEGFNRGNNYGQNRGNKRGGGGDMRRDRQDSYEETYDDYGGYSNKRSRRDDDGFDSGNWKSNNYGGGGSKSMSFDSGNWKSSNYGAGGSGPMGTKTMGDPPSHGHQNHQSRQRSVTMTMTESMGAGHMQMPTGHMQMQNQMQMPASNMQRPQQQEQPASWDMPVLKINSNKPDPYDTLGAGYNPFDIWSNQS